MRAPPKECINMAALVLLMKFLYILQAWILETGLSLDSMPELHVALVLMMLYTDFWVPQVRITDLIHKQIPVHSRNQRKRVR